MDVQLTAPTGGGESGESGEMHVLRASPENVVHMEDVFESHIPVSAHYERDVCERLRSLYPYVDQEKTPLPRCWSTQDKCNWLVLSNESLHVTYSGQGKNPKDAAAVRADHPIPVTCGVFYFEVLVISNETDCCMGIGLCEKNVDLNRLPGWDKCSYGYHGDDGNFFCSSGSGTPYGPTFSSNDIVGCGVNLVTKSIFYTKNGTNLGNAISGIANVVDLYPMVGLQKHGEIRETNFGIRPFRYDIQQDMQEALAYTYDAIYRVELPQAKTGWMNQAISSWLAHEGYSRALNAFTKATEQKSTDGDAIANRRNESSESMETRRALQKLVLEGKVGEAIARVETLYPNLFSRNKELALLLKIQQFVEMLIDLNDSKGGSGASMDSREPTSAEVRVSRESVLLPKSTRLSGNYSGIESSAQVFTQTGRSFTVTSGGTVIGANGSVNPFKRRSSQECYVHQARRSSLRASHDNFPGEPFAYSTPAGSSTANGNSFVHSTDEPMDEDCALPCASHVSSSNGTSHEANGNSLCAHNGRQAEENGSACARPSATTIVAEEFDDSLGEYAREESFSADECRSATYSHAELAPYERMRSLLEFGRSVNSLSMQLVHPPQPLINMMHDAFALICQASPLYSPMGYLMDSSMREKAATAMNSAILEFLGYPPQSLLARHLRTARDMREELALAQVGAAVFADVNRMVLGEKIVHR